MNAKAIRQTFLDFFAKKSHQIVASAPIVVKDDPTLMFTNAGMNQFKDYFLGNKKPTNLRIANSQKCLRVSGKHNDLEEVGVDTYHHTMFEMLGNWSFGDYFKQEAIAWAWELLTEVYNIPKDRLYITVFEGDKEDGLTVDQEAYDFWKAFMEEDRIILASKKDNFWEMGDTGPCGPCSEIHVDIRSDEERAKVDGKNLVNQDHPLVIEIWNLVFIQYNRKANKSLEALPAKHIDTGMGFERLCMVLQAQQSNYDTDVFTPLIQRLAYLTDVTYGKNEQVDTALRVIADHIRAITFTIQDGQLPSNNGAGYVVRRILRRAVRYYFSYLNQSEPLLYQLIPVLIEQFGELYPELAKNKDFLQNVIQQEEQSFLRTLESGLKRFTQVEKQLKKQKTTLIDGKTAFELYDTFGFPIDLTRLIASENKLSVDEEGFKTAMQAQKDRARDAAKIDASDWTIVNEKLADVETTFRGYDLLKTKSYVIKYREVKQKKKTLYQLVLDQTPFYAESGGQVGDTGYLDFNGTKIYIIDTKKENNLILHIVKELPDAKTLKKAAIAQVNKAKRHLTASNHTGTHLLHAALREVLGTHVQQKGSMVSADYFRFDFSHFAKLTDEELAQVEARVNEKIRENIPLEEWRNMPIEEAKKMGAMALFGEKYGDYVRVIVFDKKFSVELCGGTHVPATGELGFCKIRLETSVAAGVRRIEAMTNVPAYTHVTNAFNELDAIKVLYKNPKKLVQQVTATLEENAELKKQIEQMQRQQAVSIKNGLKGEAVTINGVQFIGKVLAVDHAGMVKQIAFDLRKEVPNLFLALGATIKGKAQLTIAVGDQVVADKGIHAGKLVKTLASKHIKGGGGGQAFYATAGGKLPEGLESAISEAAEVVKKL